jgi:hypothetical protein
LLLYDVGGCVATFVGTKVGVLVGVALGLNVGTGVPEDDEAEEKEVAVAEEEDLAELDDAEKDVAEVCSTSTNLAPASSFSLPDSKI